MTKRGYFAAPPPGPERFDLRAALAGARTREEEKAAVDRWLSTIVADDRNRGPGHRDYKDAVAGAFGSAFSDRPNLDATGRAVDGPIDVDRAIPYALKFEDRYAPGLKDGGRPVRSLVHERAFLDQQLVPGRPGPHPIVAAQALAPRSLPPQALAPQTSWLHQQVQQLAQQIMPRAVLTTTLSRDTPDLSEPLEPDRSREGDGATLPGVETERPFWHVPELPPLEGARVPNPLDELMDFSALPEAEQTLIRGIVTDDETGEVFREWLEEYLRSGVDPASPQGRQLFGDLLERTLDILLNSRGGPQTQALNRYIARVCRETFDREFPWMAHLIEHTGGAWRDGGSAYLRETTISTQGVRRNRADLTWTLGLPGGQMQSHINTVDTLSSGDMTLREAEADLRIRVLHGHLLRVISKIPAGTRHEDFRVLIEAECRGVIEDAIRRWKERHPGQSTGNEDLDDYIRRL